MNNRQIVGNTGLFYTCYELSRRGFIALPTIRNSKGADIFIFNNDGYAGIQVKAMSVLNDVRISHNYKQYTVDYWVIILDCMGAPAGIKSFVIPESDIIVGMKQCRDKGVNSNKNLVYFDEPKNKEITNFWINRKYFSEKYQEYFHKYYEKWDMIKCHSANTTDTQGTQPKRNTNMGEDKGG